MNEENNKSQNILIENRNMIKITGVNDVLSFDDNTVTLVTDLGTLVIKGDEIKIEKLNIDLKEVTATGNFYMTEYISDDEEKKGGFFSKILR